MPKRIPKVPLSKNMGELNFEMPSESSRNAIETKYGHKLPPKAWAKLAIATGIYLTAAQAERDAMPIKDLQTKLTGIVRQIGSLRNEIYADQNTNEDGLSDTQSRSLVHKRTALLKLLISAMDHLTRIAEVVSAELTDTESLKFEKGIAWESWVYLLTLVVTEYGLPHQVRKDAVIQKAGQPDSPFALFVDEVQKQLVPEQDRRRATLDTLAQAIVRARRGRDLRTTFFDALIGGGAKSKALKNLRERFG